MPSVHSLISVMAFVSGDSSGSDACIIGDVADGYRAAERRVYPRERGVCGGDGSAEGDGAVCYPNPRRAGS